MGVIYDVWVFNKHDDPIFSRSWNREAAPAEPEHIVGLTTMVNQFMTTLATPGASSDVKALQTGNYKLHLKLTQTGYRFVMVTDVGFGTVEGQNLLMRLYRDAFVVHVAKNPVSDVGAKGAVIESPGFADAVREILVSAALLAPAAE